MKNDLIAVACIIVISLILSIPYIFPGFPVIHDDQQVARLFVFDKALRAGQFPVRWVDGLGFGFGYPLFVFYPPLVYIVGETFHFLGFGFIESIKLVFFLSILGSGLAMYILVKSFLGKISALISALFYMMVPYRALDVYVRGALAESFSFVWLPLILWSFYKLIKTNHTSYIYLSGAFLALLMITHNLIFLSFMLILPAYLLFLVFLSPDKKKTIYYLLFTICFSFGLSAFFWIPALVEKKFTIVDDLLLVNLANYNIHFVYPRQLWNWTWGFGGSAPGLMDGISFKIGKLHIISSIAALILAVTQYLKKNQKSKFIINNSLFIILMFSFFLFSAFMTTFYSKPIWNLIKPLSYLQFPWRFLTFSALFSSILAGALIYLLRVPVVKLVSSIILIVLLIYPNFKLFKPQAYRQELTDEVATNKESVSWYVSSSSFEYLPNGVKLIKNELGANVVAIDKSQIPDQKAEVTNGSVVIKNITDSPSKVNLTIDAKHISQIKANIFDFPGWQVKINGQQIPINSDNPLKLITFSVPQGLHQVTIEFKETLTRKIANLISLISILVLAVLIIRKWKIPSFN